MSRGKLISKGSDDVYSLEIENNTNKDFAVITYNNLGKQITKAVVAPKKSETFKTYLNQYWRIDDAEAMKVITIFAKLKGTGKSKV